MGDRAVNDRSKASGTVIMERTEPAWLCIDDGQKEIEIDIILTNLR